LKKGIQTAICCPWGNEKILALGLCATCYTLKRHAPPTTSTKGRLLRRKDSLRIEPAHTRAAGALVYQAIVNALPLPTGPLVDPAHDNSQIHALRTLLPPIQILP